MDKNERMEKARKRLVGFAEVCGLELSTVEKGVVEGLCEIGPALRNPHGFVHGGAINTMMDTFGGIAAGGAVEPPRSVVTRSSDVHYLRPVLGGRMIGRAEVVKAGGQMCLVRTAVYDEEERLCAEGLLEFYYLDKPLQ